VPSEALSLALAASIYPPALAAVIALGRGAEVRLRVVLFVAAAYLTVLITGALMMLLFDELGATSRDIATPGAGLYVLGGAVLLLVAARIRSAQPRSAQQRGTAARVDRYLQSRRLVLALGVVLYVVPSPIFVGAVKAIADAHVSTAQELLYLVQMLVIMLWIIELPMLVLIAFPVRGVAMLERVNGWFAAHGRALLVLACGGLGVYLFAVGLVELLG
jgi:hypothetical protein